MRKLLLWVLILLLTLLPLAGCGQGQTTSVREGAKGQQNTVAKVLEAGVAEATEQPTAAPTQKAATGSGKKAAQGFKPFSDMSRIDVDLASLSATMVYSEVYAMMEHPEEYVGKVVRMHGLFATSSGQEYYFCVIQDATACCSQGIEFILAGNPAYPNGYPKLGEEFTVTGVFEDYREGSDTYYHLRDAVLEG